ncbi:MAG: hypothetical protein EP147_02265 [Subdoligranulum sp.]|nr:hypothetical protein [Subdoligranulum sp.]
MKTKQELAGIYVASITAYDQAGNVDAAALQKLMQRNINEGAAGFFVGGSSGECFMLTEAERVQVFEAAAAYAGKTNLIAHVGAIGTAEAVRYAKAAMGMGYDVVAATAPFYYGFSPKEVCRYYYDIAEASGSPVLIYNFPAIPTANLTLPTRITSSCSRAVLSWASSRPTTTCSRWSASST